MDFDDMWIWGIVIIIIVVVISREDPEIEDLQKEVLKLEIENKKIERQILKLNHDQRP